jgi:hypothetical protein
MQVDFQTLSTNKSFRYPTPLLQSKLIKGATLKVYKGAPHGLCTTEKENVNADLLAFLKA